MKGSFKKALIAVALTTAGLTAAAPSYAEITANASVTSNYIWRGLTQTTNDAAVQGGIDYANESGFYAGTWVSNVNYGADDVYSYEHDLYFGFSGESGDISYDVGYLYYNYDAEAEFDFAEVYGSVGFGGLSVTLSLLANGIGTGDEVITTNFTAYPTVAGIINSGATPILVDVSLDNALIDVNLIEAAISQKTRAIIPVHLYGHPCNMKAIKEKVVLDLQKKYPNSGIGLKE